MTGLLFIIKRLSLIRENSHPFYMAGIAVALALVSVTVGFVSDDHFFRMVFEKTPGIPELRVNTLDTFSFGSGDPEYNLQLMKRGLLPWWTDSRWQTSFWRPLSSLTHFIDHHLWGERAWIMHIESILCYAALAFATTRLYLRHLSPPWCAALAALLYVVSSTHGLPIAWLSNRNALLTTLFSVMTLLSHDTWRRLGEKRAAPFAMLWLALALLSGEAGVAVGGYLFAYACFVDKSSVLRRIGTLVPYMVIVIVWRAVYSGLGYGVHDSGLYTDPGANPSAFLFDVITFIPILIFSHFFFPDPLLWSFVPEPWPRIYYGFVVAGLIVIVLLFYRLVRRDPICRFYAVGMVLSCAPSCATLPQYRLLMLAGVGGMGLLARFLADATHPTGQKEFVAPSKRFVRAAVVVGFWLHLVVSPLSLVGQQLLVGRMGTAFTQMNESLPMAPAIVNEDVIILSSAGDLGFAVPTIMRSSLRQPLPRHMWTLYSGIDESVARRVDDRTIIMRVDKGWLPKPWAILFRRMPDSPIDVGYTITLGDMEVEVLKVNDEKRPSEVKFTFAKNLEDQSLHWYVWQNGKYASVGAPRMGEQIVTPPVTIRSVLDGILGPENTPESSHNL